MYIPRKHVTSKCRHFNLSSKSCRQCEDCGQIETLRNYLTNSIPFTWSACLLAEYPAARGAPVSPTTLLTVTMLPAPCSVMWGSTCLVTETVPRKLSSIKAWYTSILVSMHRERWLRPPLLMRISIWETTEMWTEFERRKTPWLQC